MYINPLQLQYNNGFDIQQLVPNSPVYIFDQDLNQVFSGISDSNGFLGGVSINGSLQPNTYTFINTTDSCSLITECFELSQGTAQYYLSDTPQILTVGNAQNAIISGMETVAYYSFIIIIATLAIGLAYLVFRFGWKRLMTDKSLMVGGFYLRNVPYKGYKRFRSAKWNMKNTM